MFETTTAPVHFEILAYRKNGPIRYRSSVDLDDMAETERILLNHYKLPSLFPAEWPAEKDESDASSDEEERNKPLPRVPSAKLQSTQSKRMSRSRFSVLERSATKAGSVPGSQKTKDGHENIVQKDEADPLGMTASVVNALRRRGLPVEDDAEYSMHSVCGQVPMS